MPLYEYRCAECGNTVEVIQKVADLPLSECTACGGELERLLSASAIQFKGSGWYVSEYARKNGPQDGSSDKEGKSESKSESTASTCSSGPCEK